jgi:hypothetical protein
VRVAVVAPALLALALLLVGEVGQLPPVRQVFRLEAEPFRSELRSDVARVSEANSHG